MYLCEWKRTVKERRSSCAGRVHGASGASLLWSLNVARKSEQIIENLMIGHSRQAGCSAQGLVKIY